MYEHDVDPKQLLSNERTYFEWLQMAITLGGIGLGLLGFAFPGAKLGKLLTQQEDNNRMAQWIGIILLPLALLFGIYGCWLYMVRREKILYNKGSTHPGAGPVLLGATTFCALTAIFLLDIFFTI